MANNILNLNKQMSKINADSNKWDHSCDVEMFTAPRNMELALQVHLDNLVLTYGFEAVRKAIGKTDLNIKKNTINKKTA
jgi:hypothetical protein